MCGSGEFFGLGSRPGGTKIKMRRMVTLCMMTNSTKYITNDGYADLY